METIVDISDRFQTISNKPEIFVSSQDSDTKILRHLLKTSYDLTKQEERKSNSISLPELIIENFDLEQIWQQLELQNNEILDNSVAAVSRLAVSKDRLVFQEINQSSNSDDDVSSKDEKDITDEHIVENETSDEGNEFNNDEDLEGDQEDLESNNEDLESDNEGQPKNNKLSKSAVDDKFFKLNEMNDFLLTEEKKLNKNTKQEDSGSESEGSINMFELGSEDENENYENNDKLRNPRYKDFFAKQMRQRNERENVNLQDDDDDNQSDKELDEDYQEQNTDNENDVNDIESGIAEESKENEPKSTLEIREQRLKNKIKKIEEAAISEKPWQLKGEITAENRPDNSLLQEVLEFDLTTRPAPVITEQTTYVLEDIIKQRIKDKAFDDVQRKQKPVENVLEFKKKLLLDQEKSKESLAQIYEKEYIQQKEALNPETEDKVEEEPKLHQEIKTLMHNLFSKLDTLSNFHFTPKPVAPELRIVSNLPAISMEEVAPISTSDATLLAPEEVQRKNKGDVKGQSERTATDKNRERRKKKRKQREHAKEKEKREKTIQKLNPGLGNKYSKEKMRRVLNKVVKDKNVDKMNEITNGKSIKSSTAFFTQLQDEVKQHVKIYNSNKVKKNNKVNNAKRIKL